MRSSSPRHRGQAGQSVVEALVAAALLGIAAVVALTTMDAATLGAKRATRGAWAQCSVRQLANAIESATWSTSYGSQDPSLRVNVVGPGGSPAPGATQTVTVSALDPDSGRLLYQVAFLRVAALQGSDPVSDALPALASGCQAP